MQKDVDATRIGAMMSPLPLTATQPQPQPDPTMSTITIQAARSILAEIELSDEQVIRAIEAAAADAAQWAAEAAAGQLPDVSKMELDWHVDADLREAGVNGNAMQRLSFAIARATA